MHVFLRRRSTVGEAYPLLICLDATKCVLLDFVNSYRDNLLGNEGKSTAKEYKKYTSGWPPSFKNVFKFPILLSWQHIIENCKIFYFEWKNVSLLCTFSKLSTLPTSGTNLSAVGFWSLGPSEQNQTNLNDCDINRTHTAFVFRLTCC